MFWIGCLLSLLYVPQAIRPIDTKQAYLESCKGDSNKVLVDLARYIPDIVLDIRYATKNNFTKTVIYPQARAFLRKKAADALKQAQQDLAAYQLGFKIFDAYRPYSVTVKMYEVFPNKVFLAHPKKGSRHNRACAIDVTLVDRRTRKELGMPTPYDYFSKKAFPDAPLTDTTARKNRDFLIRFLKRYGFEVSLSEWWHFDFQGYKAYEILDIPFSEL